MPLRRRLLASVFNGPVLVSVASWHARPGGAQAFERFRLAQTPTTQEATP